MKYYEVEGAVMRKDAGKRMELYCGAGKWEQYTGDESRIYNQSNVLTIEEVKPYMDEPTDKAAA
jgi:hypothetical protein